MCVYNAKLEFLMKLIVEPESEITFEYVYSFIVIEILKFRSLSVASPAQNKWGVPEPFFFAGEQ